MCAANDVPAYDLPDADWAQPADDDNHATSARPGDPGTAIHVHSDGTADDDANCPALEPMQNIDRTCTYCGKVQWDSSVKLRQVRFGASISWLCPACFARQEQRYESMTRGAA